MSESLRRQQVSWLDKPDNKAVNADPLLMDFVKERLSLLFNKASNEVNEVEWRHESCSLKDGEQYSEWSCQLPRINSDETTLFSISKRETRRQNIYWVETQTIAEDFLSASPENGIDMIVRSFEITISKTDGRIKHAKYDIQLESPTYMKEHPEEFPLSAREYQISMKAAQQAGQFGNYQLTELNKLLVEALSLTD